MMGDESVMRIDAHEDRRVTPYHRLWKFVLAQALTEAMDYFARNPHSKPFDLMSVENLEALSALRWLHSKQTTPGSFIWVCSHLDINPHYIHTLLDRAIQEPEYEEQSAACA